MKDYNFTTNIFLFCILKSSWDFQIRARHPLVGSDANFGKHYTMFGFTLPNAEGNKPICIYMIQKKKTVNQYLAIWGFEQGSCNNANLSINKCIIAQTKPLSLQECAVFIHWAI